MPSSNRTQVTSIVEVTLGTTPGSPRMRTRRMTGESLKYVPLYVTSNDIRSDRMTSDPIETGTQSNGAINFELIYPKQNSPLDVDIQSAMYNNWTNTPSRDNDGTADSVITDIGTSAHVVVCATGAAFVVGHLVQMSGNAEAANNGVFRCTTGSATVPAFAAPTFTAQAVPPAASRMKVVGFAGVAADITATASGLGSTLLDFTTLGLAAGMWIKVGGTAAGDQFATAALNTWIRITGIAATALTCDNLPAGWTTDAGTGKTIKVWYGDRIINGTTQVSQTIEKGFLGQTVPTYIAQKGMVVSQFALTAKAKSVITGSVSYMGMGATQGTSTLSGSPDAAPSVSGYPAFAASANVGRIGEAGATLASPNFVDQLDFTIANNTTEVSAVDSLGPAGLTGHEATVSVNLSTYFGDNSLLTKFFAGTATSLNMRASKGSQAQVISFPRLTYTGGGSPNAGAKNQDVMLALSAVASKDETTTNALICWDRLEYVESP